MSYSEKLKDPRWATLRETFKAHRRNIQNGLQCDDCGEDTSGPLHVHHRLYRKGAEPWEYSFDELRLLCVGYHDLIHSTESEYRAFIIALRPHFCYELIALLDEFAEAHEEDILKVCIARAKNVVRDTVWKKKTGGGMTVMSMRDMAKAYLMETRGME